MEKKTKVEINAQTKNDEVAEINRNFFKKQGLIVLNLISSPGSGKTSILEVLAEEYGKKLCVITGDIQTTLDADRINKAGATALQIETGGACHLTAFMIKKSLEQIDITKSEILIIENIGNLVCPSTYDLGEDLKIAVLSVTEGDEKPIKYPALFTRAHALIVNKIDLLPHVDFNMERVKEDCYKLNNKTKIFKISCKTREGFIDLISYLKELKK